MKQGTQSFSATIHKAGINPCVTIPKKVSQVLGKRGYIAVRGTLNAFPIRATLVPIGKGRHRLYINGEMRKGAKVETGDSIRLALALDTKPRIAPMPAEFARALRKNRRARALFGQLRQSEQRQILLYLNWLKRPETVKRNVRKIIAQLLKKQRYHRKAQYF